MYIATVNKIKYTSRDDIITVAEQRILEGFEQLPFNELKAKFRSTVGATETEALNRLREELIEGLSPYFKRDEVKELIAFTAQICPVQNGTFWTNSGLFRGGMWGFNIMKEIQ